MIEILLTTVYETNDCLQDMKLLEPIYFEILSDQKRTCMALSQSVT